MEHRPLETLGGLISLLRSDLSAYLSERLAAYGLTPGLYLFLRAVGERQGATPSEIAAATRADSGHTARSLQKLEERGLLARSPNPADRRSTALRLTPAGEEALAGCRGLFAEWDQQMLSGLTEAERQTLFPLLAKLVHQMRHASQSPARPESPGDLPGGSGR